MNKALLLILLLILVHARKNSGYIYWAPPDNILHVNILDVLKFWRRVLLKFNTVPKLFDVLYLLVL